ncbi:MAG: methionine adenosyltransferase [bacterium]
MSTLNVDHVFSSESVGSGHPDKICDQISDAILDACLALDSRARVACETIAAYDLVLNAGEITCAGYEQIDTEAIARQVVREIGYDRPELLFTCDSFQYINRVHGQSPNISQGVTTGEGLFAEQGAGDQGMMFGYATNETPEFMPLPLMYSHKLLLRLEEERRSGKRIPYLRPDSKGQLSVRYIDGKPAQITSVVISHQTDEIPHEQIYRDIKAIAEEVLAPTGLLCADTDYYINPTGAFILGGAFADSGLTGRKIIVDTYGGVGRHGGGCFSGKDPSKVDRSAAYYARYAAKNIVAAGLADKCEIQVAYAIGVPIPLNINVSTFGTGNIDETELEKMLASGKVFDFRPAAIIADLGLMTPQGWSYRETASYGHFGRPHFPWEKLDRVAAIEAVLSATAKA